MSKSFKPIFLVIFSFIALVIISSFSDVWAGAPSKRGVESRAHSFKKLSLVELSNQCFEDFCVGDIVRPINFKHDEWVFPKKGLPYQKPSQNEKATRQAEFKVVWQRNWQNDGLSGEDTASSNLFAFLIDSVAHKSVRNPNYGRRWAAGWFAGWDQEVHYSDILELVQKVENRNQAENREDCLVDLCIGDRVRIRASSNSGSGKKNQKYIIQDFDLTVGVKGYGIRGMEAQEYLYPHPEVILEDPSQGSVERAPWTSVERVLE